MRYKKFILLIVPTFILFLFLGCNTYLWQPVDKLVVGTWVASPNPTIVGTQWGTEKWVIESGGCITVQIWDSSNVLVDSLEFKAGGAEDDELTPCIEWSVESKFTKHYLRTDRWFYGSQTDIEESPKDPKWLIVKINKEEMYLSAELENKDGVRIKGTYQKGFIRE